MAHPRSPPWRDAPSPFNLVLATELAQVRGDLLQSRGLTEVYGETIPLLQGDCISGGGGETGVAFGGRAAALLGLCASHRLHGRKLLLLLLLRLCQDWAAKEGTNLGCQQTTLLVESGGGQRQLDTLNYACAGGLGRRAGHCLNNYLLRGQRLLPRAEILRIYFARTELQEPQAASAVRFRQHLRSAFCTALGGRVSEQMRQRNLSPAMCLFFIMKPNRRCTWWPRNGPLPGLLPWQGRASINGRIRCHPPSFHRQGRQSRQPHTCGAPTALWGGEKQRRCHGVYHPKRLS